MSKLLKKLVALGLVASLAATSTVTAFAEDGTPEVTGGEVSTGEGTEGDNEETPAEDPKEEETPAEDPKEEEADEAVVWVNGKDIKANAKKEIKEKLNKTYYVDLADLLAADAGKTEGENTTAATEAGDPDESEEGSVTEAPQAAAEEGSDSSSSEAPAEDPDAPASSDSSASTTKPAEEEEEKIPTLGLKSEGGKYLVNVLPAPGKDEEANTYADAFDIEKDKVIKNADGAKMAKASFDKKSGDIKVVAGKTAGSIEVWVAELDADKEIVAYNFATVEVKMAPAKFTVQIPAVEEEKEGEAVVVTEAIAKKATVSAGTDVNLEIAIDKPTEGVSEDATYTWTIKAPKTAEEKTHYVLDGKGAKATFNAVTMTTATKADKYTITCTNDQSGKKSTFAVTVANDISDMTFGDIALESAAEAASELNLMWNTDVYKTTTAVAFKNSEGEVVYATTDKIKAYVTSTIDTEEAKAWSITTNKGKDKFTLTGEKSKALTVKVNKDGSITLKAKKGTEDATKVQVIFTVTHVDKTIDVYTAVVTIGEKKAAEDEKKCTCDPAPAEGEAHKEGCPLYEAPTTPTCTCDPAPAEGEAHAEGCPLYVAPTTPTCTCDPAPEEGAAHAEGCPLYVAPEAE